VYLTFITLFIVVV